MPTASSAINQKLSAIRKPATEAEDNNLIDSRLAMGILIRDSVNNYALKLENEGIRAQDLRRTFACRL